MATLTHSLTSVAFTNHLPFTHKKMMRKTFSLATLSLLLTLSFAAVTNQIPWLLVLFLFSLFPFVLNFWLVPGGFAWRNCVKHYPKLPGPIGWPFFGSIPLMGSLAHRKLADMSKSLGATRLMAFSLGNTRMIISSHPETAKQILCGPAFSNRPVKVSARILMFECAIGFAPSGEYWRQIRRIAANHMFSPKQISNLEGLRQEIADDMLAGVGREMKEKGIVELREILHKGSLCNVIESLFGKSFSLEGEELGLMVEEGYELIGKFNWVDYFAFGFLDFHGVRRRCHSLAERVKGVVGQIINERRTEGDCMNKSDFLSVLLRLPEEEGLLSDSDMVAILWEMIFRGTDTVAILLEWIMARMVLHPDIQVKAQEELDAQVGSQRQVQDTDIPNLPYLQSIVKEVLRMHPPGPLMSWSRLAIDDVHVDKFFIPAGTTAMVNMWAIAHDGSIWKDPWVFRPERFTEEDVSVLGSDLRLAPFGAGRRACPGKALGLSTVHLWLARLLHQFTWLPGQQPVDLSESLRLSLEMKKPVPYRAIRRSALQH